MRRCSLDVASLFNAPLLLSRGPLSSSSASMISSSFSSASSGSSISIWWSTSATSSATLGSYCVRHTFLEIPILHHVQLSCHLLKHDTLKNNESMVGNHSFPCMPCINQHEAHHEKLNGETNGININKMLITAGARPVGGKEMMENDDALKSMRKELPG